MLPHGHKGRNGGEEAPTALSSIVSPEGARLLLTNMSTSLKMTGNLITKAYLVCILYVIFIDKITPSNYGEIGCVLSKAMHSSESFLPVAENKGVFFFYLGLLKHGGFQLLGLPCHLPAHILEQIS